MLGIKNEDGKYHRIKSVNSVLKERFNMSIGARENTTFILVFIVMKVPQPLFWEK